MTSYIENMLKLHYPILLCLAESIKCFFFIKSQHIDNHDKWNNQLIALHPYNDSAMKSVKVIMLNSDQSNKLILNNLECHRKSKMEIRTHLYFIILIFRRSELSRFIWYFLLILNIIMFCMLIRFNNSLVSQISVVQETSHTNYSHRFLDEIKDPMPNIISKMEDIRRESSRDVLDDGFDYEKYNAVGNNSGNRMGSISNFISIKRRLKDVLHPTQAFYRGHILHFSRRRDG